MPLSFSMLVLEILPLLISFELHIPLQDSVQWWLLKEAFLLHFSVYLKGSCVLACLLTHCFQLFTCVSCPSGQMPSVDVCVLCISRGTWWFWTHVCCALKGSRYDAERLSVVAVQMNNLSDVSLGVSIKWKKEIVKDLETLFLSAWKYPQ